MSLRSLRRGTIVGRGPSGLSPLEIPTSLKAWYDVSQESVLADNASMSILTDRVGSNHANIKLGNGAYYRTNRTPSGKPTAQWIADGARLSTGVDNFFDVGDVWTIGFVAKNVAGSGKGTGSNGSGKRSYGWESLGARGVFHLNYSADPAVAWPHWVNASWPDWSTQFAVVLIVCTSAGVASCTVNGVPSSIFSQGSGFETNWDNAAHFGFGGKYMGINAEYHTGEMAEWALWDAAISAGNQTSLINYWMQKHGITAPSDISVTDSFDRADNASSMGNADTGQTWVPVSSTWGISGNKAYIPTPANDKATWLNAGISDGVITCYLTYQDPGDGILFRGLGVANNDGFLCYLSNTNIVLVNPGFGANLIVTPLTHTPGVTYKLQASFLGNAINIFEDDVWRGVVANATQQTATRIGLRSGGATAGKRWENLSVR